VVFVKKKNILKHAKSLFKLGSSTNPLPPPLGPLLLLGRPSSFPRTIRLHIIFSAGSGQIFLQLNSQQLAAAVNKQIASLSIPHSSPTSLPFELNQTKSRGANPLLSPPPNERITLRIRSPPRRI
jgi:hypothetical protein